ncbi:hypothetical protein AT959_14915 [Dechloromonas denitrificans]|uniref:Uncharacterized protein n=1 Tax=Dechloromonas denitrificans TaxID=281362 RepID=A0A133XE93_9RHOO|nr:hypothetical protein [Dechloromonas denitrificans]KXB29264.1 hypothetical protein AT959_14915 [Dechloromonas denitrificans]
MNTTLKRRLERLERLAGRNNGAGSTSTLIEPAANASEDQWHQFAIRKAEAEAAGRVIVAIRSVPPVRPIAYLGRVVIVPPKIPAVVEVRAILAEGNSCAH